MARDLESRLIDLLGDPVGAALQTDLTQAVVLRNQELLLRQRVGAAEARLRRAAEAGAATHEIATLEALVAKRSARLDLTTHIAETADIRRPAPAENIAQLFGRATGTPDRPPVTAALLSASGMVLDRSVASDDGVFHLKVEGALENVLLQLSDKASRILYRSPAPFDVAANTILQVEVALDTPEKKPGSVPDRPFMPDLIGQNEEVALVLLKRLGLKTSVKDLPSDSDPNIVVDQTPPAGRAVSASTEVGLTVSRPTKRKDAVDPKPEASAPALPDFTGTLLNEARAVVRRLKLKVVVERRTQRGPADIVIDQNPRQGTPIAGITEVRLLVSKGAKPAANRTKAAARSTAKSA